MNVATLLRAKGARIVTILGDSSVETLVHRMTLERIGALVVTDADGRQIIGIVSERDVVRGLAEHGEAVLKMPVEDLMTRAVKTCRLEDGIKQVMATMTRNRIRHLPVVEGGDLVGVISIGDVVKYRLEEMELEVNVLRDACLAGRAGLVS